MNGYVAQKATVELTGITTGGSGKAFAKGTGAIDIGLRSDIPIDLPGMFTRQVNFNQVGFFTPRACSGGTQPPPVAPDTAALLGKASLRKSALFVPGAFVTPLPENLAADSKQNSSHVDVRSQATLACYERGSGITTELVKNMAYATLTKNPNQPNGQSFVLSLYNSDPCA